MFGFRRIFGRAPSHKDAAKAAQRAFSDAPVIRLRDFPKAKAQVLSTGKSGTGSHVFSKSRKPR